MEENRSKARDLFRKLNTDKEEELRAQAERYRQSVRMPVDELDEFPVDKNDALAIRQSLLPTTADPAMWCVRCQEGKEKDVVRDLLAKFLIAEHGPKDERLHIYSAHCVEGDKGRIYVEARKESHVRTALALIPFVRLTSPFKLLRRSEMPRVLVAPEKAQLVLGQWVRIKNGIYRDDLAQVYELIDTTRVTLRLVPRISKEQYDSAPSSGKRVRAERSSVRPVARVFRPGEVADKTAVLNVGERTRVTVAGGQGDDDEEDGQERDEQQWLNMRFKSGLLIKEFRTSGLHTANIHPTLEEVNRFRRAVAAYRKEYAGLGAQLTGAEAEAALEKEFPLDPSASASANNPTGNPINNIINAATSSSGSKMVVYSKGDHIQVTRGEYISVTGIVTMASLANVEFRPDDVDKFGKRLIAVPAGHVRKYFGPGEHVKILAGVFAGETGTITAVHEDTVSIYSDVVHKEISANMSDLQIAFSTGTGNTSLASYHLFDLVSLGDNAGVIVDVERDGFQILGDNGQTRYVPLAEVGARRNMTKGSISDAHNNYVNLGETVRILEGQYKDVTGILKHIHKATVFVQCQNSVVRENRGLVCLRKHHVASVVDRNLLASGGANASAAAIAGGLYSVGAGGGRVLHGMGGGSGPAAAARRIDPSLQKKEVIVKRGQWKGYRGMIKTATEREYTVLLSTGSRIVKVPKDDVEAADAISAQTGAQRGGGSSNYDRFGFNNGGASHNEYNGSQTPARMATPRHPSSGGYDSYGARSSSGSTDDDFDPNYRPPPLSSANPSLLSSGPASTHPNGAPATGSFLLPQTPGFGLGAHSSASGLSSSSGHLDYSRYTTPGGAASVPYTPGGAPYTPGAGMLPPLTPGGALSSSGPSSMLPMTPSIVPSTPGGSAPGYGGYGGYGASSYAGVPSTPGIPATPGGPSGGFAIPQTPAYNMIPSTPGYNVPATPGGGGMHAIPSTPYSSLPPLTPGVPMTPGGLGGSDLHHDVPSAAMLPPVDPDAWCQAGFEVYDTTSAENPAPRYVILDAMKGTPLVKVEALSAMDGSRTGRTTNMTRTSLRLVPPMKKDKVAVIATGKIYILIGIDEQDGGVSGGHGIVKNPDDSEIQVLPMSSFAKVHSL